MVGSQVSLHTSPDWVESVLDLRLSAVVSDGWDSKLQAFEVGEEVGVDIKVCWPFIVERFFTVVLIAFNRHIAHNPNYETL